MANDIPDSADPIRWENWRQGSLIIPTQANQVTAVSIDYFGHVVSSDTWLVVLTQDCDLVRNTDIEPFVELLALRQL